MKMMTREIIFAHAFPKFAKAAGAVVIATTSTKEKEETLKKLGADHVINYKEDPNWGETAKKLSSDGEGVHHVIEVGGANTMTQSLKAVRLEGIISIVGFLGGSKPEATLLDCLSHGCIARGMFVGSKAQMDEMVAAIEVNDIHPIVDKTVFEFEKAKDAYQYLVCEFFALAFE